MDKLVENRRYFHEHAEVGFELEQTKAYIMKELRDMGYEPKECGKAGVVALVGGKKPGKVFMLRADVDALPIPEETGLAFASKNGNMHACGHDFHGAMLLEAARILKQQEDEIQGTVKLMFQPAEEIFEGAQDMIDAGVLENPKVDAAIAIHVIVPMDCPTGSVCVYAPGVGMAAADFFKIKVQGKGCHGSLPQTGVDPLTVAAHILLALQEIHGRELAASDEAVLTIGKLNGGSAPNIIPDTATMEGSIRTYDEEIRSFIKKRMTEITESVAKAFRAEAVVEFGMGTPSLLNDKELSECVGRYSKELVGEELTVMVASEDSKSSASEDFACISRAVPGLKIDIAAGQPENGYIHPHHHPKTMFDENVLPIGSKLYAHVAMRWLEEHS